MNLADFFKGVLNFKNYNQFRKERSEDVKDVKPSYDNGHATKKRKPNPFFKNMFTNTLTFNNLSTDERNKKDVKNVKKVQKGLEKDKNIVLNSPESERYEVNGETFLPGDKHSGDLGKVRDKYVNSTCIEKIDYSPDTKILKVRFVNGDKDYAFPNVPKEEINNWVDAASKGRFYHNDIKQYSVEGFRG